VWNYFIGNLKYCRRVLEYSLRYSPSTREANYSDSTALKPTASEMYIIYILCSIVLVLNCLLNFTIVVVQVLPQNIDYSTLVKTSFQSLHTKVRDIHFQLWFSLLIAGYYSNP